MRQGKSHAGVGHPCRESIMVGPTLYCSLLISCVLDCIRLSGTALMWCGVGVAAGARGDEVRVGHNRLSSWAVGVIHTHWCIATAAATVLVKNVYKFLEKKNIRQFMVR